MKVRRSVRMMIALGLLIGSPLLLSQCSLGAGGTIEGPAMLYFYAEW